MFKSHFGKKISKAKSAVCCSAEEHLSCSKLRWGAIFPAPVTKNERVENYDSYCFSFYFEIGLLGNVWVALKNLYFF